MRQMVMMGFLDRKSQWFQKTRSSAGTRRAVIQQQLHNFSDDVYSRTPETDATPSLSLEVRLSDNR
jgi:hypothetical protein